MSRIEKGSETKEELKEFKGEVIKEINAKKGNRPWMTCSLVFILFIFGSLSFVAWAVAATGLVSVPGFSFWAYHESQPERTVTPGVPIETVVSEEVKTALALDLMSGRDVPANKKLSLSLSEASLTASLRTLLEKESGDLLEAQTAQVLVTPEEGFVFFLPLKNSVQQSVLQFSMKADVLDGVIQLSPSSVQVGSLSVPDALSSFVLQPFIQENLELFNKELSSFIQIEDLEYQQGSVIVDGVINVHVLEEQL